MGKQTKKEGSNFGGDWTIQKLSIIDQYLSAYTKVLKNSKVKTIYIDGFAGSGETVFKSDDEVVATQQTTFLPNEKIEEISVAEGSAVLSLKYDFDGYYFVELDADRMAKLKARIKNDFPEKFNKIKFLKGDANKEINAIMDRLTVYDRCLMFIDPFSLEMNWETLKTVSTKAIVDLWYLFPMNALIRNMPKDMDKILQQNINVIEKTLGITNFKEMFYEEGAVDLLGSRRTQRISQNEIIDIIKGRLKETFAYVYEKPKLLTNARNSILFLLCFMMTNDSEKAVGAANRIVDGIMGKLGVL